MILKLLHRSHFAQISWVIVFALIFSIPAFFQNETIFWSDQTLFLKLSCLWPVFQINWIYQSLHLLLLLSTAFIANYIFTRHHLIHHSNFLPGLIIVVMFGFQQAFELQLISTINLFLLTISYSYLLKSFDDITPDNSIFSAALFIGLASFLSYGNIAFIVLLWISFFVFQNYSWRYFPISLAGLLVPYLFLSTWLYWNDQLNMVITEWNIVSHHFYELPQIIDIFYILIYTILGFLIFLSLSFVIPKNAGQIISIRKKVWLSLWFLLLGFILLLFSTDYMVKNVVIIPLSLLLGYYLRSQKIRQNLIDIVFSLFILLLMFNQYYQFYVTTFTHQ